MVLLYLNISFILAFYSEIVKSGATYTLKRIEVEPYLLVRVMTYLPASSILVLIIVTFTEDSLLE